jgi:hypothetical protein
VSFSARTKREAISRQRYEHYQQYQAEQERNLERPPYRVAAEIVDYADIEQRAMALVEAHQQKPKSEMPQEYADNARTAIFEALTASGHLSTVEVHGKLDEIHGQVTERLLNGYDINLPTHELKRRFREICEELVRHEVARKIIAGDLPPDTCVMTDSTYVTNEDGMTDQLASSLGYRPYNHKGMARSTELLMHPDKTVTVVIEQVSYSNSSAHDSILRLHQEGIVVNRSDAADIDLLGTQLIASRTDMAEGVIGLQRRIDAFRGTDVRFGQLPDDNTPTYERLREVSKQREAQVGRFVDQLAAWEETLDRNLQNGEINRQQWSELYGRELHNIIQAICVLQPDYTKDALGESVVSDYQAANQRLRYGDSAGAADIVSSAASREQDIIVCGMSVAASKERLANNPQRVQQLLDKETKKENWRWTKGKCVVRNCPTRPKQTTVGPCSVCVGCQHHYDAGHDPHRLYETAKQSNSKQPERSVAKVDKKKSVQKRYGDYAVLDEVVIVGATKKIVRDRRTNKTIAELPSASF